MSGKVDTPFKPEPLASTPDPEDRPIDRRDLIKVARIMGDNYKALGRAMDVPDETIEEIKKKYEPEGLEEVAFKVMYWWMQNKSEEATLLTLANILRDLNQPELRKKILEPRLDSRAAHPTAAPCKQGQVFSHVCSGASCTYSGPVNVGGTQTSK